MKKILIALFTAFIVTATASAQCMKVYQNGQLKAIYYVSKDDKVEFSDDFPFPEGNTNPGGDVSGNTNGHAYVDLGLSVKWATMNVGATSPEGYGEYFAWGETQPKGWYDWSTYKWCNGSYDSMTKYCTNSEYGQVDNKTTLDPDDDAAHVNWGGAWRMPTRAEQDELRNNCTWTWTSQNGVNGYKVVGPNGNSLFLPAAGYRFEDDLNNAGSYGYYWSSSLNGYNSYYAYDLYFNSGSVDWGSNYRYYGFSVRPVCQ